MTTAPEQRSQGQNGQGVVRASWAGTTMFALTSAAAAAFPDAFGVVALVVALALFLAGIALFCVTLVLAAGRSRTEELSVAGIFFLQQSAPRPVQRALLGSLALEVVVAVTTAAVRPFTSLAFGVLSPVYGLALAGLWAARHGAFARRRPVAPRQRRQ